MIDPRSPEASLSRRWEKSAEPDDDEAVETAGNNAAEPSAEDPVGDFVADVAKADRQRRRPWPPQLQQKS